MTDPSDSTHPTDAPADPIADAASADAASADAADAADVAEAELDAFDLDHDGRISLVESERARLGVIDARLEEIAEEGGIKGKLADGVHHLLDKLDND